MGEGGSKAKNTRSLVKKVYGCVKVALIASAVIFDGASSGDVFYRLIGSNHRRGRK